MRGIDAAAVNALLVEVGRSVILPRFRQLQQHEIDTKSGPHDLVTIADREAEAWLAPRLQRLLPESRVVGEEATSADEGLMLALAQPGLVWVIDPVDGTANFATGNPLFAVMVSLVRDGAAVMSWIHDPVRQVTAMAVAGEGAWMLEADGTRRRFRCPAPPSLAHLAGAPNLRYGDREFAARIASRLDRTASVMILRCAGQEYMAMAEGQIHYAVYNRALPWDHAAGCLLIEEAGGVARRLDGSRYRAADRPWGSPLVVACGEDQWNWLKTGIFLP